MTAQMTAEDERRRVECLIDALEDQLSALRDITALVRAVQGRGIAVTMVSEPLGELGLELHLQIRMPVADGMLPVPPGELGLVECDPPEPDVPAPDPAPESDARPGWARARQDDALPPSYRKAAVVDADGLKRGPWSEEEDLLAIAMRAEGRLPAEVAEKLERPVTAVSFRLNKVLRQRIEAARKAAAGSDTPAPPPPPTAEEHVAELVAVGAVAAEDYELMRLAILGWQAGEIAMDMDMGGDQVKARFEALTDNRRLKREDVLAALAAYLPDEAGDAA